MPCGCAAWFLFFFKVCVGGASRPVSGRLWACRALRLAHSMVFDSHTYTKPISALSSEGVADKPPYLPLISQAVGLSVSETERETAHKRKHEIQYEWHHHQRVC